MTWLLTIWMITADGTMTEVPVGVMIDKPICEIAGSGFQRVLQAEDHRTQVMWKCDYVGASA